MNTNLGLRFADDGTLDAKASSFTLEWLARFLATKPNVRFVAHEFRRSRPQQNKEFAQKELDALRRQLNIDQVSFVAQGSDAGKADVGLVLRGEARRLLLDSEDVVAEAARQTLDGIPQPGAEHLNGSGVHP